MLLPLSIPSCRRLGSTQTTVAQLQLHYTKAIHTRAAAVVKSFLDASTDADYGETPDEYDKLCQVGVAIDCFHMPS